MHPGDNDRNATEGARGEEAGEWTDWSVCSITHWPYISNDPAARNSFVIERISIKILIKGIIISE
jgi:hypothetical protein